jgi:hypothetical protein
LRTPHVDHDRRAAAAGDIAELLSLIEVHARDLDHVEVGVVAPHANRDDVRGAVLADGGDAGEPLLAVQILKLLVGEGAGLAGHG